ncbi:MAG: septum site-determining protein MinD [Candidatus Nanohaloarchaea archaeon]|jgi:septum site-determining protein MinD
MTRLICVSSGKGGVGKTTVTANLGAALTNFGADTVVLDANLTNPNLGFHIGIPLYPKTLHDVLKGDAHITEAMYIHDSGLRVVPAGLSVDDLKDTSPDNLADVLLDAIGEPDFVLVDSAAGLGNESLNAIEASDEVLIVTNPNLPAVTDALKTVNVAEEAGTEVNGVVLNMVKDHDAELSTEEVESMIGYEVLMEVPHHEKVEEALAVKKPVVHHAPDHHVSERFKGVASEMAGLDYEMDLQQESFIDRMMKVFR